MREVLLNRYHYGEHATLGEIYIPDINLGFSTLELPWKNNEPRVSCIPEGTYTCEMRESPKFGWRYILRGTEPDRTYILIHPGNYPRNTYGCILLGASAGTTEDGGPAVWNSRKAVGDFEKAMNKEPFELSITSEDGVPG